jgi:hypothetical protein
MQGMGNRGPRVPVDANRADAAPEPDALDEAAQARDEQPDDDGNEQPEATPDRHRVKVNGEEIEVTLDELKSGYGRMKAATQKFQEASEARAEVEKREGAVKRFIQGIKTGDPQQLASLLRKVGVDPDRFAEAHLTHTLKLADMPAHERGMLELQREREAFQREQQTMHSKREEEAIAAEVETTMASYVSEAQSAFQAAGVKPTPTLMARAGAAMEHALTHGYQMTMREAVGAVLEDVREAARTMGRDAFAQHMGDPEQAERMKRQEAGRVSQEQRRAAANAAQKPMPRGPGGKFVKKVDPTVFGSFADAFAARAEHDGRVR